MKYARRVVQQLLSESDWEWDTSGRVARRVAWSGSGGACGATIHYLIFKMYVLTVS